MKNQSETENKAIFPKSAENKRKKFFFPDHGVTVEAENMEEAKKILKKRKQ